MTESPSAKVIFLPGSDAQKQMLPGFLPLCSETRRKEIDAVFGNSFASTALCLMARKETGPVWTSLPFSLSRFSGLRRHGGAKTRENTRTQEEGETVARKTPEESWGAEKDLSSRGCEWPWPFWGLVLGGYSLCPLWTLDPVLFYRSSRAECQRSIHWTSARRPLRSGGEWAPRSS